ncbi:MAG: hypothetical protein KDD44_03475, partial [Bdellovibrionales bacterium]|nr:hypothetical protein [Bdellovibrionales bacterium]
KGLIGRIQLFERLKASRSTRCGVSFLCAEHVWQLGGASPPSNLMEVKDKRLARASPRGGV